MISDLPESNHKPLADVWGDELRCEAGRASGTACQESPPRGQLVNLWVDPNFAQTIEFSTKFSETPLRKLILLTERLSVEIGNLIPFIYLGRMKINSTFIKYFGEKHDFSQITNQKLQIRVTTVLFHISP